MSEGPEVRRTPDRLAEVLVGERVDAVRTYGKHLVIAFSRGVWLHNHMMM